MNKPIRIQRLEKVCDILLNFKIKSVCELGCGDGKLIPYLKLLNNINTITVIDKNPSKINRIQKMHPDVMSRCASFLEDNGSLYNYDCILAIEVIEHLNQNELDKLVEIVFKNSQPRLIIFTTPNIEYNINYPILYNGYRHKTHLFEFTPLELKQWGDKITTVYKDYSFYNEFCDTNNSSQIIVFYRRLNDE